LPGKRALTSRSEAETNGIQLPNALHAQLLDLAQA